MAAGRALARQDNYLALTRDQFTATSPLNLFNVGGGSTPGGVRVSGRELVGAVTAPGIIAGVFAQVNVGAASPFAVNPFSFPRLSSFAPIYEYYRFHKLAFMFQANQPTTAIGEILLAIDYDVKDNAPGSSIAMMRNISSTMANIYSDASLELLASLSRLPKFDINQAVAPDVAQVNQASLYVAIEGVTTIAGQGLGYIVAQYDVEFFTPQ
jgi:hypothetical protein